MGVSRWRYTGQYFIHSYGTSIFHSRWSFRGHLCPGWLPGNTKTSTESTCVLFHTGTPMASHNRRFRYPFFLSQYCLAGPPRRPYLWSHSRLFLQKKVTLFLLAGVMLRFSEVKEFIKRHLVITSTVTVLLLISAGIAHSLINNPTPIEPAPEVTAPVEQPEA